MASGLGTKACQLGVQRVGKEVTIRAVFGDHYDAIAFFDLWLKDVVELQFSGGRRMTEINEGETIVRTVRED